MPLAQDGDTVRDLHHLFEFVGDEDYDFAALLQPAEDSEEVFDLVWRQDGGGFVEDDDLGVAAEGFEDFDALLRADG